MKTRIVVHLWSQVSHPGLECRLSLWEEQMCSAHVHNKAVEGFSLHSLCSTELSPICPSLNICCGNAVGLPDLYGEVTFDCQQRSLNYSRGTPLLNNHLLALCS